MTKPFFFFFPPQIKRKKGLLIHLVSERVEMGFMLKTWMSDHTGAISKVLMSN